MRTPDVHLLSRSMTVVSRQRQRGNTFKAMLEDTAEFLEALRGSDDVERASITAQAEAVREVLTSDGKTG